METWITTLAMIGLVNVTYGVALVRKIHKRSIFLHMIVGSFALILSFYLANWDVSNIVKARTHPNMNPWMVSVAFLMGFIPLVFLDVLKRPIQKGDE